jgi:ribosomal protein S18 acetylase RimI-like enzyme
MGRRRLSAEWSRHRDQGGTDLANQPNDFAAGITYVPFRAEDAERCASLEAAAFNPLRKAWGQPRQSPRSVRWLRDFAQRNPEQGQVARREGQAVGYCLVTVWGRLGWLGPVAVHPEEQGRGIGLRLVGWGRDRLKRLGCTTIALETWPHNMRNIGLYLKAGFDPGPLVLILEHELRGARSPEKAERLGTGPERGRRLRGLREMTGGLAEGLDYTALMQVTLDCELGEVLFWGGVPEMRAGAVLHYQSHGEGPPPPYANLELLVIRPGVEHQLESIIGELESRARKAGKSRLRVSLSSHHVSGVQFFLKRGYRLRKSRLRMYHSGGPLPPERVDYLSYVV